MPLHAYSLLLMLLAGGAVLLGAGCLVMAICLLSAGTDPRADLIAERVPETPAVWRWNVRLLVVFLGGALVVGLTTIWLWHLLLPARDRVLTMSWNEAAAAEPWRVDLFPWT